MKILFRLIDQEFSQPSRRADDFELSVDFPKDRTSIVSSAMQTSYFRDSIAVDRLALEGFQSITVPVTDALPFNDTRTLLLIIYYESMV